MIDESALSAHAVDGESVVRRRPALPFPDQLRARLLVVEERQRDG
jgi:hypothetical protein